LVTFPAKVANLWFFPAKTVNRTTTKCPFWGENMAIV